MPCSTSLLSECAKSSLYINAIQSAFAQLQKLQYLFLYVSVRIFSINKRIFSKD